MPTTTARGRCGRRIKGNASKERRQAHDDSCLPLHQEKHSQGRNVKQMLLLRAFSSPRSLTLVPGLPDGSSLSPAANQFATSSPAAADRRLLIPVPVYREPSAGAGNSSSSSRRASASHAHLLPLLNTANRSRCLFSPKSQQWRAKVLAKSLLLLMISQDISSSPHGT